MLIFYNSLDKIFHYVTYLPEKSKDFCPKKCICYKTGGAAAPQAPGALRL